MNERPGWQDTSCAQGVTENQCQDRWFDEELYEGLGKDARLLPPSWPLSPLRIVHVCKFFPPERGGMETYVHDLAQEQASAGHQVTVLAHTASTSRRERMPEGYTVSRSRVWMRAADYVPVAPGLAWDLAAELWRKVRDERPHILHVHCPNPAALWCVLLAGRGEGAPRLVVHWHSDVIFPQERQPNALALALWRRMERALLARADRIIATSQPYLESSEFLAPWRAKCVVAPLRLSAKRPKVPRGLKHPALDFLRGVGPETAQGDAQLGGNCCTGAGNTSRDEVRSREQPALQLSGQGNSPEYAYSSSRSKAQQGEHCLSDSVDATTQIDVKSVLRNVGPDSCASLAGAARAVLGVGRLAHYKGFEVLVRAVANSPSLRCCIIGEGEEGPKLRALVRELGVQDRVLLPGEVDDDVLAACYEACDVFCLPSLLRTEAFGVVLLEALRAGKWCVVSDVPGSGMGTVIQHGVNGWLVPPGDVAALGLGLEGRV